MPLQVTVLGLGYTGAALGLALGTIDPKALDVGRPAITGWDRDKRAMSDARGRLAVDQVEPNLQAAVRNADVVVVSVPFSALRDTFASIASSLKPGAIVTDTTPTKAPVMAWASELLPATVEFVGGHPFINASEDGGRVPTRDALRDAIYCLVPLPRTRRPALDGIEALVTAIGAKPYYIDAAEHDSYVAAAAHLPLAASVALMQTVGGSGAWPEIRPIAGDGLVRMTEMAAGGVADAADALNSNAAALEGWIDRLVASLVELRQNLHNPAALQRVIEHTRDLHEDWIRSEPNLRPGENAFNGNLSDIERPNLSGLFFGRRRYDRDKRR
jgi:prephenate dehydrogenase